MKKTIIALSLLAAFALASCSAESSSSEQSTVQTTTATEATAEATTAAPTTEATERATAPQNEVGYEGMTEVGADELRDGDYHISVDSSSSMFRIADCILHVTNGRMTADIIIASKSYDALYMGTEDEARNAAENITYTESENGQSVFSVPVEALDKEVQCAALSAKKQEWYGRTLVFRADSLPDEAFIKKRYIAPSELGLEDGEYTVEVRLTGGSGKASIESPATFTLEDGHATVKIVWSSDKYDKMEMQGGVYLPTIVDGHSVFSLELPGFDYSIPVGANTIAMSEPHMIDYTLCFDSTTIEKCE